MVKRKNMDAVGKWAFLAGVVLAIILGFLGPVTGTWAMILVAIGLIVGLLNVADKEVMHFLMSGAILILSCQEARVWVVVSGTSRIV